MKSSTTMYYLAVTYNAVHWSDETERALMRAVGRRSDGSGMGLGERDHTWWYKTSKGAKVAMERLKANRPRGLAIKMAIFKHDCENYTHEWIAGYRGWNTYCD